MQENSYSRKNFVNNCAIMAKIVLIFNFLFGVYILSKLWDNFCTFFHKEKLLVSLHFKKTAL